MRSRSIYRATIFQLGSHSTRSCCTFTAGTGQICAAGRPARGYSACLLLFFYWKHFLSSLPINRRLPEMSSGLCLRAELGWWDGGQAWLRLRRGKAIFLCSELGMEPTYGSLEHEQIDETLSGR